MCNCYEIVFVVVTLPLGEPTPTDYEGAFLFRDKDLILR